MKCVVNKCTKARLKTTLKESRDSIIGKAAPTFETGRKLNPKETEPRAKAALKPTEVEKQVQNGRGVFGLGTSKRRWSNATPLEQCKILIEQQLP